jgi:ABC-type transport system involved in multi-copper enzyme maturation permease subunit
MTPNRMAQLRAVMRLELRKSLFGRRSIPVYLIGLVPLAPVVLTVIVFSFTEIPREFVGLGGASLFFILVFEFILRLIIYFGCVWVFMNLFRGEIIDRSLHYYFLTPIRREVLVAGKYLSGWLTATIVFGGSTLISFLIVYGYLGSAGGGGALSFSTLLTLLRYLAVVALACLGYGAVFLVVGLFLRSIVLPAFLIFLWELANPLLPAALKKISVIFYLQNLRPLPPLDGPVEIIVEPVSMWIAVPGFLIFTALTLVAAAIRVRRMEIAYGND